MRALTYWLSLVMIFMMPWEGVVVLPGLGTASRLMGLLVAGLWLFTIIVTGKVRKPIPVYLFIFLYFMWNMLSILWTVDVDETLIRVVALARMAGLALIILDLYDTPTAVRSGLQAYLLGLFVPAGSVITNFLNGSQSTFGRYSASGDNANTTSILLAFGVPLAWYLAISIDSDKRWRVLKMINYAYIPLGIGAIVLTATRFALVMTFPAIIFGLVTLTRLSAVQRGLIFVLLTITLWTLPTYIPQSSFERLATAGESISSGNLNGRVAIWQEGFEVWLQHPFIGIGTAAFESIVPSGRAAHNSFLAILTETGVLGLLLFSMILYLAVVHAQRMPRWDAWFWLTLLVVWGLGNMVLTWSHTKSSWLFFSLLFTHVNLFHRQPDFNPDEASHLEPTGITFLRQGSWNL